jgi:ribosome biogenesis GTPase / thiamine phosphate phosphatase
LQPIGRNCSQPRFGERRQQLGATSAVKTIQLGVDHIDDQGSRRSIEVPLDDGRAVTGGGTAEHARWTSRAVQYLDEHRQGFGYCRVNSQRDDGRTLSERRIGFDRGRCCTVREFDERVRAVDVGRHAPVRHSTAHSDARVDFGAPVDVERIAPQHAILHDTRFVRRERIAILRVGERCNALVVSTGKNSAWVSIEGEDAPRKAQLKRMTGKRSMPVPGDVLHVRTLEDGDVVVDGMEERTMTLQRQTSEGRSKTMAANLDLLVTVTALANPAPRLPTLDQLLAFAELQDLDAAAVFTKPDLAPPDQAGALASLYGQLGYKTVVINPKQGQNVDALRDLMAGKRALLAGNSGVGKSTIFSALGGEATVGNVSRYGMGRQTTTAARLYRTPGGFLIDSPGLNEFGLGSLEPRELAMGFREMSETQQRCRFTDCRHLQEPGCAIREAVGAGTIAASRYDSFRAILAKEDR